ncbi:YbaY family lipoprotein [Delftia acidovorans]|uniref:YbaY family lipoprotein n=1 Tax=Delftia acidovorans TaxID=80866 RepID=UPI00242E26CE|nr:YbaY family lipoprotein [Delftia acidovorans]
MNSNSLQRRTALALVMSAALLGACAQTQPAAPNAPVTAVMGTVDLREPAPLAPDAVLVVELQDTSRADAPAPVISQQSMRLEGLKPPYSFKLPVEPSRLNPAAQYTVTSRITQGNQLIFINDTVHPVLTRGAGSKADMMLVRVAP